MHESYSFHSAILQNGDSKHWQNITYDWQQCSSTAVWVIYISHSLSGNGSHYKLVLAKYVRDRLLSSSILIGCHHFRTHIFQIKLCIVEMKAQVILWNYLRNCVSLKFDGKINFYTNPLELFFENISMHLYEFFSPKTLLFI